MVTESSVKKVKGKLKGKVVGVKDKTLTVLVSSKKRHPLYEKLVRHEKKYQVHNPENKEYSLNQDVVIAPGRKVSKTKSHIVLD